MIYSRPNSSQAFIHFKSKYSNFIGGEWSMPVDQRFFDVVSPVTGEVYTTVPRSNEKDIENAIAAAHKSSSAWAKVPTVQRAQILWNIADRIDQNKEQLALAETWGNGKPIRETLHADIPLCADHFRYFSSILRADETGMSVLDEKTVSYHYREPYGVVAQIIPWNFPLLMAAWKLAPALAAGNCVILKPAEQTPVSVLLFAEMIQDLLPPGVLNIVNGFGLEAGKPLASSPKVSKIAFTGETSTGRMILGYAAQNIVPVTVELGGKSPNIFLEDVLNPPGFSGFNDEFVQKCLEGFAMFALNQGEVCTCPSRALIQNSIYDKFLEKALERVRKIRVGNPLDTDTMMGAQVSAEQMDKIQTYISLGKKEGAKLLTGGNRIRVPGLENGYYLEPTVFEGCNKMRIFQEEIFGPVLSVTRFDHLHEAIQIANETQYGLGAGVWTRSIHSAFELGKQIKAGRVWTNCYHLYPAHATFGGFKQSGIGRECHKMLLDSYSQIKNVIISYDNQPMGLF